LGIGNAWNPGQLRLSVAWRLFGVREMWLWCGFQRGKAKYAHRFRGEEVNLSLNNNGRRTTVTVL
jgi:hypothetical protein